MDTNTKSRRTRKLRLRIVMLVTAVLLGLVTLDRMVGRPCRAHWGATPSEVTAPMPGDTLVTDPDEVSTRAITIRARPDQVWPWLAQMGRGRGGLYSYDWLDRLFGVLDRPSAQSVLPEFQGLASGDTIPVGGGAVWPVALAKAGEVLLIHVDQGGARVSWVFTLRAQGERETRLVTRVRGHLPDSWSKPIATTILDYAEFIMVRRQLLNVRERAERLAAGSR
jgi:hypothetical protein